MGLLNWLQQHDRPSKPEWSALKRLIRSRFPHVQHITTDELADWLSQSANQQPVLLDTRTEAEFAVSHLLGAERIEPDTQDLAHLSRLAQDTPIVTYCSVGYRSSALCDRLRLAGFTRAVNLEGSIFAWANAGYPVYRNTDVVRQVHPYNAVWGVLLHHELHAYHPEDRL